MRIVVTSCLLAMFSVIATSSETFSRSYLQGLPEERKQKHIDNMLQKYIHEIKHSAGIGKTSYTFDQTRISQDRNQRGVVEGEGVRLNRPGRGDENIPSAPVVTNEDLIAAFQKRFPDCDVSYQETWVDVNPHNRVLKKGILIDWS